MPKWNIDPDHSVAAFSVRHLMVTNVRGQFGKLTGTINFDPSDIAASSVELTIDVSSITTGIQKRDDHLRSPDFLDAEKFPSIVFKSVKAESMGGNKGRVTGGLSVHGITKQVSLDVEFSGPVKAPFGGEICMGFSTETVINREDFGITWNEPLEGGGVMVGRELHLNIDIEADLIKQAG
ncbi:MAG: hypothetical protein A2077_00440 [Nitrospirae bacterium GWC2_46_6]|nr:MAG: hypothetical protein A2077_00440 [Nitrospirae bacterium GWC2_46_6]OGW20639.1 MAG: hypothetical protein A2Z82_10435 [Nitrospirae bacterium GWA2_46_11]OGW24632.1 MAG: hypothetical protein A2X55_06405 [Nitrospirae bacterium GWB2_47_37]HAK88061.1 polyisoprenoid-binding protein [Nitrospiraceae bacterium]HCZ11247.1 polyisoprenoid-binding protein [Nitrospiraceae bacterium]